VNLLLSEVERKKGLETELELVRSEFVESLSLMRLKEQVEIVEEVGS